MFEKIKFAMTMRSVARSQKMARTYGSPEKVPVIQRMFFYKAFDRMIKYQNAIAREQLAFKDKTMDGMSALILSQSREITQLKTDLAKTKEELSFSKGRFESVGHDLEMK